MAKPVCQSGRTRRFRALFSELFPGSGHTVGIEFTSFSDDWTFAATVPEPATWELLLAGLGLVGFSLRRRAGSLPVKA
jgi:hypothetical protein